MEPSPNIYTGVLEDSRTLLESYGINSQSAGHYFFAGTTPSANDKIIYLTVVQSQLNELLHVLLPVLKQEGLSFSVIKNQQTAKWLLDGKFGYGNIGKVLMIFIPGSIDLKLFSDRLVTLTSGFKGPFIPDMSALGGIVYSPAVDADALKKKTKDQVETNVRFFRKKYFPLTCLKKDFKGNVLAGIYLSKYFIPSRFVIKQGRYAMWSDTAGRDMADRLKWQYRIHSDLKGKICIPGVIDLFEAEGNYYLATEFIRGKTLERVINQLYKGRCWLELKREERIQLLGLLLQVLTIVNTLHENGYYHRDLSPANFMLSNSGQLYLMDFELTYSTKLAYPLPAFGFGTPGFMSQAQKEGAIPSLSEDIFALSAFALMLFTNMPPLKFDVSNFGQLCNQLTFFVGDWSSSAFAIFQVLNEKLPEQYGTGELKLAIEKILNKEQVSLNVPSTFCEPAPANLDELSELIDRALNGLIIKELTSQNKIFRGSDINEPSSGNIKMGSKLGVGLEVPVTALLMLTANERYSQQTMKLKNFLEAQLAENFGLVWGSKNLTAGLLDGLAGKAIALGYAETIGLTSRYGCLLPEILACFATISPGLDLANGVSGQLLAALQISTQFPNPLLEQRISLFADTLVQSQQKEGNWDIPPGLAYGVSGVLIALLKHHKSFPKSTHKETINKGLRWLKRNGTIKPQKSNEDQNHRSLASGICGVALTFFYAYEVLKDHSYKKTAEDILTQLPVYPVYRDFTLMTGLCGWGIVYLEAHRITANKEWLKRANWIYQVLKNTQHHRDPETVTWNMKGIDEHDGSLLSGTAGIVLFLLHFEQQISTENEYIKH